MTNFTVLLHYQINIPLIFLLQNKFIDYEKLAFFVLTFYLVYRHDNEIPI